MAPTLVHKDGPNILFADINGDGRADYLVNSANGGLDLWLNTGAVDSADITWIHYPDMASGFGNPNIALADLNGDGRADYLMWDADGDLSVYLNVRTNVEGRPTWVSQGGSKSVASGTAPPGNIRMADLNDDGKADYVIVNDTTGAIEVYLNSGEGDGIDDYVAVDHLGHGMDASFADIDGDGRADYIWLDKDGSATVYINEVFINPQNWVPANNGKPIASGVGASRSEVRFADINGDGRADYVWIHTVNGAADMWYNGGPDTGANGAWLWYPQGQVADGIGCSGPDIQFGRLDTSGRAAYVAVNASNGALRPGNILMWISATAEQHTIVADCELAYSVTDFGTSLIHACYTTAGFAVITGCDAAGTAMTTATIVFACPQTKSYTPWWIATDEDLDNAFKEHLTVSSNDEQKATDQ
ncbi:hypothetical protein LTR08_006963 [Meristemomyces frigidus]|nr:hypothetical protein LTR08_006963 [Meristemomyces frigidus]